MELCRSRKDYLAGARLLYSYSGSVKHFAVMKDKELSVTDNLLALCFIGFNGVNGLRFLDKYFQ